MRTHLNCRAVSTTPHICVGACPLVPRRRVGVVYIVEVRLGTSRSDFKSDVAGRIFVRDWESKGVASGTKSLSAAVPTALVILSSLGRMRIQAQWICADCRDKCIGAVGLCQPYQCMLFGRLSSFLRTLEGRVSRVVFNHTTWLYPRSACESLLPDASLSLLG